MTGSVSTSGRRLRFRRFSRKHYAAFCSLHREVSIGRVSAEVCNCQLRKSGGFHSQQCQASVPALHKADVAAMAATPAALPADAMEEMLLMAGVQTMIVASQRAASQVAFAAFVSVTKTAFLLPGQKGRCFLSTNHPTNEQENCNPAAVRPGGRQPVGRS